MAFLLTLFSLFFLFLFAFSHGADTLFQGDGITKNRTIVSAGDRFCLGWFSPSNTANFYIAIWYNNISPITTVWVANRDNPVKTITDAVFGIADDGNLEIKEGNSSRRVWSTDASPGTAGDATARLLDSGNLILRDENGTSVWESFDHPTDTFLPNMTIKLSPKSVTEKRFTSWRSESDPGIGRYAVGIDPRSLRQVYVWKGSEIWWRSGLWDGSSFIGTKMRSFSGYHFDFGNQTLVFVLTGPNLVRFVVQHDGVENVTMRDDESKKWVSQWAHPVGECEVYNVCGSNMVCRGEGKNKCECLEGYVAFGGKGCVRKEKLRCEVSNTTVEGGEQDGFVKVEGVKLPDMAELLESVEFGNDEWCRKKCVENCTCGAYAFVYNLGCMLWDNNMVDLQTLENGAPNNVFHVKLAASELGGRNSKRWILPLALALAGGLVVILLCSYLCYCRYRTTIQGWKKRRRATPDLPTVDNPSGMQPRYRDFSCSSDVTECGESSELPFYTFDQISEATDGFSFSKKLGEGGFGEVYLGHLPGGKEIAVKRLSQNSGQGMEEFKNEATLIAKLQHRNLVRILGCCVERDEKMLVYEYLANKSLDVLLFDPQKKASNVLDWPKRFDIIKGIARGLLYLHRDSRLLIIHRDLKASNILLDEEMAPKISDFGMARLIGSNQNQENTVRVVGTFGYMSPEYAMEGIISIKSDVYSFGVLMLEIVSGNRNNSYLLSTAGTNISRHAWTLWDQGKAMELVDPLMGKSISSQQVLRCINVALLCTQDRAIDRPIMSTVMLMLEGEVSVLAKPRPPTYVSVGGDGSNSYSSLMGKEKHFTSSSSTVTSLSPR